MKDVKINNINNILNGIIAILIILILITGTVLIYADKLMKTKEESMRPKYHFYFIGQNQVDPFWKNVQDGIEEKAMEYGVKVEFNSPRFTNSEEQLKYIDIAVLSRVDGIITHAFDTDEYREAIRKAEEKGIPVIIVENEIKDLEVDAFVGADSFSIGRKAGQLMNRAINGEGNVLIIEDQGADKQIEGFTKVLEYSKGVKIANIESSNLGTLSAEEIVDKAIKGENSINAIYVTNSIDTIGAAQAVINNNKVGDVQIIGYGDTEEIKRLIDLGVVYGTTIGNPQKIGIKSLETLVKIKEGEKITPFVNTGYRIIK